MIIKKNGSNTVEEVEAKTAVGGKKFLIKVCVDQI